MVDVILKFLYIYKNFLFHFIFIKSFLYIYTNFLFHIIFIKSFVYLYSSPITSFFFLIFLLFKVHVRFVCEKTSMQLIRFGCMTNIGLCYNDPQAQQPSQIELVLLTISSLSCMTRAKRFLFKDSIETHKDMSTSHRKDLMSTGLHD